MSAWYESREAFSFEVPSARSIMSSRPTGSGISTLKNSSKRSRLAKFGPCESWISRWPLWIRLTMEVDEVSIREPQLPSYVKRRFLGSSLFFHWKCEHLPFAGEGSFKVIGCTVHYHDEDEKIQCLGASWRFFEFLWNVSPQWFAWSFPNVDGNNILS